VKATADPVLAAEPDDVTVLGIDETRTRESEVGDPSRHRRGAGGALRSGVDQPAPAAARPND
jgi:hypothetical protein